ncbi:hypothetical protein IFM89_018458 [Coptis chinensis]|uniref:Phosphatidic acid phosphatase type 2/haloperoxidase domain-containing protein n=1 Tax=Coptis chinensis TaxID=261450 RepID=A0A835H796_9MAGN|nr:hypothetical protein IFM89_018458 [Coptis chinensis]
MLVNRESETAWKNKKQKVIITISSFHHRFLDNFFSAMSCVVSVPFYTAFLPLLFWSGHGKLARQMTLLMAVCDYMGNCIKDVVSAPRPSSPPVRRVTATKDEKENALEYGLPSSHTLNTVCLSGYLLHYVFNYSQHDTASILVGFSLACLLVGLIVLGRIYLGMHSVIDVLGGLVIGLVILAIWLMVHDNVDSFVVSGQNVTSFWITLSFLLLFAYPTPELPTPSYEFHTAFDGVALGIVSGVQQTYHQFHHEGVPHIFSPTLGLKVFLGRVLVGIPTILLVKFCSKALAKWILPVVSNTLSIPIKSSCYIPMLNEPNNGKMSNGNKQSGYIQKVFFFSSQDSFDVDTGIRFLQYAGLAWSVVDLVLIEKLTNLGVTFVNSISNVEYKLKKLERTLLRVQALIIYVEDKEICDMAWQVLLRDLEELAYDADDLIDELAIKFWKLKGGNIQYIYKARVRKLFVSFWPTKKKLFSSFFNRSSSARNMNNIQVKLDDMLREIDSLCLRESAEGSNHDKVKSKLPTTSLIDASHSFNRDVEKSDLVKMLLAPEASKQNVSVISIVGMVGVGKTTLAQLVYNESEMWSKSSFNLKMWVSVTKDFNVEALTRSIIEAATGVTSLPLELDLLQLHLRNYLRDKKFLLVLDDLWNEKRREWELLTEPLRHGRGGSTIIVTTRSRVVSSMVNTNGIYNLELLSDEASWLLLRQEALGSGNHLEAVAELELIGKEIAHCCQGLPLTAKIVGNLLRIETDDDKWDSVLQSILKSAIWDLPEVIKEIVPALRSSYYHLPSHLKQCFAYCSMFPQGHEFEKDKLVQMWMGECFILPEGRRRTEEIGHDYFDQLFWMSFFQKKDGTYIIHDMIHHFAQSVAGDKFFRMEENDGSHILQTLRLKNCLRLLRLPKGIDKLESLRHLELGIDCQLTSMPSGIGKLTGLQTLSEFVVGVELGQIKELKDMNNIRGSLCIKQLERVSQGQEAEEANLASKKYLDRLELQWSNTDFPIQVELILNNLEPHKSLKELVLKRYRAGQFPPWVCNPLFSKLTSISLYECDNCLLLPSLGQLPKLKSLKVAVMTNLQYLSGEFYGDTSVGVRFQSLESLELCDMPSLVGWNGTNDNDMGRLRELTIGNCPQLVIIPSLHYLESLEKLKFENCPELQSLSTHRLSTSVRSLIVRGCFKLTRQFRSVGGEDWMKIEHIPHKEMDEESELVSRVADHEEFIRGGGLATLEMPSANVLVYGHGILCI